MRRITLILTLALLIIALTAGMALAADPPNDPTEVWVNDVQIYGGNPNGTVPGVSYDPSTRTLTLTNATITAGHQYFIELSASYNYEGEAYQYAGIFADGDLNIVLEGSNSIKIPHIEYEFTPGSPEKYKYHYQDGIVVKDVVVKGENDFDYYQADLKISGSGSLTIDVDGEGIFVHEGDLRILDSDLTIAAGDYGIDAEFGYLIINGSTLNITSDYGYAGVYSCVGNIEIIDSTLTITNSGHGIYADGHWDTVDEEYVYISDGNITITDSSVTATSTEWGFGICAEGIIDISNSYVRAEGSEGGIISYYTDSVGIVHEGVIVNQGGKVVEVWREKGQGGIILAGAAIDKRSGLASYGAVELEICGYTFSMQDSATYNGDFFEDVSQLVELIPSQEIQELAFIILGGVGKNFPFVDVGLNHWAYNDIFDAFKKGLINGKSATLYLPDGPLTYAEAIKLAACIHQLNSMGAVSFETSDPWYQTYVSYAELNQIIEKGEFAGKYNDAIIRYDFAHIFGKALPVSAFTPLNSIDSIPDVPSSNRHADEILMLYRAGILVGSDADGNFNGNSNIKRSEVAAIVVRMIDPEKRIKK